MTAFRNNASHNDGTCGSSYYDCWIQRDFFREKLRVRERYWHSIPVDTPDEVTVDGTPGRPRRRRRRRCRWILPDGSAWRTYLPLFMYLIEHDKDNQQLQSQWVLLESVAEYMDYRNVSRMAKSTNDQDPNTSTTEVPPEVASPQERSKILQLIQRHPENVLPFCDLSVRNTLPGETDEWDLMNYEKLSIADRSRNALFRATRFLRRRDYDCNEESEFWILSNDANFVQQFPEEDGTRAILVQDLFDLDWFPFLERRSLEMMEHVKKLVVQCQEEYDARNNKSSLGISPATSTAGWQEYLSNKDIEQGLRNKYLFKGRLIVSTDNPKEGMVHSGDWSFFVNQQKGGYFNRALHQDIVIVQPLPEEEWTSPVGRRKIVHMRDDNDMVEETNDHFADTNILDPPVPSGRVVAIVEESRRQYVATLLDTPMNDETACLVIPMDSRIPKIRIKTNGWQRFIGQRLWVQIDGWDLTSTYPSGHCVEMLGPIADLETEIQCLLRENEIHLDPFSAAARACLPIQGHDWTIPSSEISKRRDLRSVPIFSVDPAGCQDIDDTMHARVLPNGDIEVGVHIADVTYFVSHNSPLDQEAKVRGTTFYLVDRRFDMLPTLLSSDLCSLHGNMDRLTVSTIWTFSRDLKVVKDFWFGRTVIHNCQAMTYEQAHNILHDLPPDNPSKDPPPPLTAGYPVHRNNIKILKEELIVLTKLARQLRKDREDIGGAVDLSSGDQGNELKFSFDENGNPVQILPKKQLEIHHTIAELMILANTWVARTICQRFPRSALLRIHQNVEESRFEDLKDVLRAGKISFKGRSNMQLAESLKGAQSQSSSAVNSLFQSLATRAMSEAKYVSTGDIREEKGLSHYGLGLEKYTHFTSPIRRYADVVVHRQLLLCLTTKTEKVPIAAPPGFDRKALGSVPESETISILRGEGIAGPSLMKLSSAFDDADERHEKNKGSSHRQSSSVVDEDLYTNQQVSQICDILNRQNRRAKLSSYECQNLFLSLYFKDHVEVTQAVVTNLKTNGFWAYVPKFDFRAPVYLSDKNGEVQIDPTLIKLTPSSGMDPTSGFASFAKARRFPSGKCSLHGSGDDEYLEISVPDPESEKFCLRVLQVVTVSIFCDNWNSKSRVPQPRLHLQNASSSSPMPKNVKHNEMTVIDRKNHINHKTPIKCLVSSCEKVKGSLYLETIKLPTPPELDTDFRCQGKGAGNVIMRGESSIPGRIIFAGFVNPDTRSAQQEVSIQEAAEAAVERRNQAMANRSKKSEFETTKQIEKDVTSRMQRLAANKRNARKGKSK